MRRIFLNGQISLRFYGKADRVASSGRCYRKTRSCSHVTDVVPKTSQDQHFVSTRSPIGTPSHLDLCRLIVTPNFGGLGVLGFGACRNYSALYGWSRIVAI